MPFSQTWRGWSRDEDDHLLLILLQILGGNADPVRIDQITFELAPLDRPSHELRALLDRMVGAGIVRTSDRRLTGDCSYSLTSAGLNQLAELRSRRANTTRRSSAARSALLDWLHSKADQGIASPSIDEFHNDVRSWYEAEPMPTSAVEAASSYLKDEGLIEGQGAWGHSGPLRPRLTSHGFDCVEHHDSDVQAWKRESRSGMSSIDTGGGDYISNSRHIQTMKNSPGSQQAQGSSTITTTDARDVQDLAAHLRELLKLPEVSPEQRDQLAPLIDELENTIRKPDADAELVRSIWNKIKTGLEAAGPTINYLLTKLVLPRALDG